MSKSIADDLIGAINEFAQHLSAATLTFIAVCVYAGISVATTTDEMLLKSRILGLPLLNVEIPLGLFFILAPLLVIFLHLHLLLLVYLLQCKVERYVALDNPEEKETDLFFSSLPLSVMLGQGHPGLIRGFLFVLLTLLTVVMPLSILVGVQVAYLPVRSPVAFWHIALIVADVGLVWYFARKIREVRVLTLVWKKIDRPRYNGLRTFLLHAVLACTLVLEVVGTVVWFWEADREESSNSRLVSIFFPSLSLPDQKLVAKLPSSGTPSPDNVEGLKLAKRDLRRADFYKSVLINADFRGAKLTGAIFNYADLRGAKFSPYQERREGAMESPPETVSALVHRTDLRGAFLENADLRGADFSNADLRGANLRNASLRGANLTSALLTGAIMVDAKLEGAIFHDAEMKLTKLVGAKALGANFRDARVLGADFRNVSLHFAEGLLLNGIDLRGSRLGELNPECGEGTLKSPLYSDLRGIDLQPLTDVEWKAIEDTFSHSGSEDKIDDAVLEKLRKYKEAPPDQERCLIVYGPGFDTTLRGIMQVRDADLLYEHAQLVALIKDFPPPTIDEATYYQNLVRRLISEACKDQELALALIKDISGEYTPWRPELSYGAAQGLMNLYQERELCPRLASLYLENESTIEVVAERDPLRTK